MKSFDYTRAFSRNIGWVTPTEQELLRNKRVAIAGLGGVGGSHLLTHARLGIGAFNLADFDHFELHNFNRQAGATMDTVGQAKVDVMATMAASINPEASVRVFPDGINTDNLDEFLTDVDLYIDSLDFFAVDIRRQIFAACAEKGIPAITAAPLGMSTAVLIFLPGQMTFEEYFQLEGHDETEQLARFFVGLAPAAVQMRYLVDSSTLDLAAHQGPSTAMGCELCAGVAAAQSVKILLRRGKVIAAPRGFQIDAYTNQVKMTSRRGGMRHPLLALGLRIARPKLAGAMAANQEGTGSAPAGAGRAEAGRAGAQRAQPDLETIRAILDTARWAPSGDNTQPWRFEICGRDQLVVHGSDTRDEVVYDHEGRASQVSIGALLENIDLAASAQGLRCEIERRQTAPETHPTFNVRFVEAPERATDPLAGCIKARCTQRRMLSKEALDDHAAELLGQSVGKGFSVVWLRDRATIKNVAKMLYRNGRLRLTMPEAYPVHRDIIDWDAQYSADRLPDQAVGLDPVAVKMMRWAMVSWNRVKFLNTYMGGTVMPCLQLDYLPGLNCAAHFVIVADQAPVTVDDFVAGGRAVQRFWLQATASGLQFQPEYTPLLFAKLTAQEVKFSENPSSIEQGRAVAKLMQDLVGAEAIERGVFMGRIGYGPSPTARSVRLPLETLIIDPNASVGKDSAAA